MREYDDAAVTAAVSPALLVEEVERCLADLGRGEALQMPKAAMPFAPGSFFLAVAGMVPRLGLATSKWASYAPGDAGAPGISTSRITVSDATTGEAIALIIGMTATQLRTAATAVAAAHRFAVSPPGAVTFVGFGPTNRAVFDLLQATSTAPRDIRIAVRSDASRAALETALAAFDGVTVSTDVVAALSGADLAFSATGSTTALAAVEDLAPSAVVVSLDGSSTWTSGDDTVVLTDRVVDGGVPAVAAAFATGEEVRAAATQRVLLDIAGSAVTDVALAAIVLASGAGGVRS